MIAKVFDSLPKDAIDIRTEVFMEEQGFKDEFDNIDKVSKHIVLYDGNRAIATCRIFYSQEESSCMIGRIAVRKEYRGNGIGEMTVNEAEKYICANGRSSLMLFAQKRVKKFYEKLGYKSTGYESDDEGCPHIMMRKEW